MTLRSSDEVPGRCQITVVSCKTLGVAGTQGRPLQVVVRCNAYLDHLGQLRRKAVKVLFVRFDGEFFFEPFLNHLGVMARGN